MYFMGQRGKSQERSAKRRGFDRCGQGPWTPRGPVGPVGRCLRQALAHGLGHPLGVEIPGLTHIMGLALLHTLENGTEVLEVGLHVYAMDRRAAAQCRVVASWVISSTSLASRVSTRAPTLFS